jgi:hypothetical protein
MIRPKLQRVRRGAAICRLAADPLLLEALQATKRYVLLASVFDGLRLVSSQWVCCCRAQAAARG